MADLIAGFIGFLVILAGLTTIVIMVRSRQQRNALARRNAPQRARKKLRDLDALIDRINQAKTDDELDGLEEQKDELCGNSYSRSSSGWPRSCS
jgi:hypothetical protein